MIYDAFFNRKKVLKEKIMDKMKPEKISILRRRQVETKTGLSRSTIYLFMDEGKFPRPIHLGARSVGWVASEVEEWLAERVQHRDGR